MPNNKTTFFDSDWTKIGAIAAIGGIVAALFIAGIGLLLNFVGDDFETKVEGVEAEVGVNETDIDGLRNSTNERFNALGNETAALWTSTGERFVVAKEHRDNLTSGQNELRTDVDILKELALDPEAASVLRAIVPMLMSEEYVIIAVPAGEWGDFRNILSPNSAEGIIVVTGAASNR